MAKLSGVGSRVPVALLVLKGKTGVNESTICRGHYRGYPDQC